MDTQSRIQRQLELLAQDLDATKDSILNAWHERVSDDASLAIASRLSRAQFIDHMPYVLDTLCEKLRAWPTPICSVEQEEFPTGRDSHSRHRWQWGYDLPTLVNEWGHLNVCLVQSIDAYARSNAEFDADAACYAREAVAELLREALTKNVGEYAELLQAEAATRVRELRGTLEQVRDMEQARGELLRAAAHDLRGSLGIVTGSVALMDEDRLGPASSEQISRLRRGVHSLHRMLTNLMDMSQLEAGQETRQISTFDAAQVIEELCSTSQALAAARGLRLEMHGPKNLRVSGDEVKVRRIAQNLLLNSLKYTQEGQVTVSWAPTEVDRWVLCVKDTGPGFDASLRPFVEKLQLTDEPAEPASSTVGARQPLQGEPAVSARASAGGEGVGLTIVKRLCELLDAALGLETQPQVGTTFRVVFPMHYDA